MIETSGFLPWLSIGSFGAPTYFAVISFVLCLLAVWTPHRAQLFGFEARRALDLLLIAMISGFLGSRLLHILWEEPTYYWESPLRIFQIWQGGFVWYGGFLGGLGAIALALRKDPERWRWLDLFSPMAAAGYAAGRFACVLTGCCFGRECHYLLIWPLHYRFPTQILAVAWESAVAVLLIRIERITRERATPLAPGKLFLLWLLLHGIGRVLMEFFRDDLRGPALGPLSISMAVSLALIGFSVWRLRLKRTQT